MNLINPSVYLIEEVNPFKKVELIGRTCYKSEDRITSDSCIEFVKKLINRQHFAMLEHGVVHFIIQFDTEEELNDCMNARVFTRYSVVHKLHSNRLLVTLSMSHIYQAITDKNKDENPFKKSTYQILYLAFLNKYTEYNEPNLDDKIQGVYVLTDHELLEFIHEDENIDEKLSKSLIKEHIFYTFKFVCDRGVSHELVRHRCSVGQESTRYCNYSKDKFGGEVCFIKPSTFEEWTAVSQGRFILSCMQAERHYMDLLDEGLTPQQARAVLPNSLKTEVFLTMPIWQWIHFFNLRSIGTTGAPHPDMKQVADIAYGMFQKNLMDNNIKI